jgi:Na+-transporting NADH:ubiquinone oxidoreductase subunit NqrC
MMSGKVFIKGRQMKKNKVQNFTVLKLIVVSLVCAILVVYCMMVL